MTQSEGERPVVTDEMIDAELARQDRRRKRLVLSALGVAALLAVIAITAVVTIAVAGPNDDDGTAAAISATTPNVLDRAKAACREAVSQQFKDPYSVRFEDEFPVGYPDDGTASVSGTANGKNQFGAYAGPRQFKCQVGADGRVTDATVY